MSTDPRTRETDNAGSGPRERLPRRDEVLLAAAAPSWQRRYLVEFADFLANTPSGLKRTGGIAVLVARSWLRPGRHVHQTQERLRASLSTLLVIGVTVLAALLVFRFVSVPLPAANWPSAAGVHLVSAALAVLLYAASCMPLVSAARNRAPGNQSPDSSSGARRPLLCALLIAAAGLVAFSCIPGPDRFGLGPLSWLAVPALTLLAAVPGVGIAVHRTVQRLRPRVGVLTLASAWMATMTATFAFFGEPAVRETAAQTFGWRFVLFWFCVIVATTATVSTARGLRAVLTDRRRQRATAQQG